MKIEAHKIAGVEQVDCPNMDSRPDDDVSLIVVHCISLPMGHFGGRFVERLFCNKLEVAEHKDLNELDDLRVSSHLLIRRDGSVIQFVPFNKRAWHAGESVFANRPACNDFSVGIELEGTDSSDFQDIQYRMLAEVCQSLISRYHVPRDNIVGHSDIAPGRKTDPGPYFDWQKFRKMLITV
jgi:AmpD protein|tara:strand:+ start:110 stop:652 length:543 start_codon:yes stop_codon:yes gene_type:complete